MIEELEKKIKPCPFCGKKPDLTKQRADEDISSYSWAIYCENENCPCQPHTFFRYAESHEDEDSILLAINDWNSRYAEQAVAGDAAEAQRS